MPFRLPAADVRAALAPPTSAHPRRSFTAATLLVVASILASLTLPYQTRGATFVFAPTQDSYVTNAAGQTGTNFGTATTLQVGNTSPTRHTYLMFNVTGLTGAATSADLALWAVSASGGASAKALATPGTSWGETTINNTNAPAINAKAVSTVTTITAGTWVHFNVMSLVSGSGSFTVAYTSANTTGTVFASREDPTHPAQLTVVGPGAATVPGAPTGVGAVAGNGQATVSWTIPVSDGGSPITSYTVTSTPGSFIGTASGPTATSAVVGGLTNGTSYTFTVHANNVLGPGPESGASNAVATFTATFDRDVVLTVRYAP